MTYFFSMATMIPERGSLLRYTYIASLVVVSSFSFNFVPVNI